MDDEKNTHWLGVEGAKRNVCDRQTGRQTILRVQTMFRVYRMGGVQVFFPANWHGNASSIEYLWSMRQKQSLSTEYLARPSGHPNIGPSSQKLATSKVQTFNLAR